MRPRWRVKRKGLASCLTPFIHKGEGRPTAVMHSWCSGRADVLLYALLAVCIVTGVSCNPYNDHHTNVHTQQQQHPESDDASHAWIRNAVPVRASIQDETREHISLRERLVALLRVEEDWTTCVEKIDILIGELKDNRSRSQNASESELDRSTLTSLLKMWSFLGNAVQHEKDDSADSCGRQGVLLCKAVLPCNETITCCSIAMDGVCLELRYNHALLTPLLDDGEGVLQPWFQLLEETLCFEPSNYNRCSISWTRQNATYHKFLCPRPLQRTDFPSRQDHYFYKEVQRAWTEILLPSAGLNRTSFQQYPCARYCKKLDPTSWRVALFQAVMSMAGLILLTMSLVAAVAAFRIGMHNMCRYPNRLQLHLAVAVFLFSLFMVPQILSLFTGEKIACYEDNAVRPDAVYKRHVGCVFSFALTDFGGMMFQLIALYVAIAWWQLVLKLRRVRYYAVAMNGKIEVIWLLASVAWSVTVVVIQYKDKEPLVPFFGLEMCISLYNGSQFITYTPYILFLFCTLVVLVDGLRRMKKVRKSSIAVKETCGIRRMRRSDRAMLKIVNHLKRYMIGLLLVGSIEATFRFIDPPGYVADKVEDGLVHFEKCMIATCGSVESCQHLQPVLPLPRLIVGILFSILSAITAVLLCSWALDKKVWKGKAPVNELTPKKAIIASFAKTFSMRAGFAVQTTTEIAESTESSKARNRLWLQQAKVLNQDTTQLSLVQVSEEPQPIVSSSSSQQQALSSSLLIDGTGSVTLPALQRAPEVDV